MGGTFIEYMYIKKDSNTVVLLHLCPRRVLGETPSLQIPSFKALWATSAN